jgi:hypothetical protein
MVDMGLTLDPYAGFRFGRLPQGHP